MNMKDFSLEGKVAWVTGASYGIGFAIASAFAAAGAKIIFNDIKQELVDKGLASYKEAGIEAKGYVCDVTNEDVVNATVEDIIKEFGKIDILVNNAGIIKRIPMCEMKASEFRQVIDVDLNAPFIVSKAVIPCLQETSHQSTASTTSSATVSGQDISQHRRQHLSERDRLTAAAIRSTSSSFPRHRQDAGAMLKTFRVLQYSLHPMHQTSSTVIFFMLTAVSLPISANSRSKPEGCTIRAAASFEAAAFFILPTFFRFSIITPCQ